MTKKKDTAHDDTRAKIMELLRAADGEPITARMLAAKIKTGEAAIKHVAEHMVDAGAIRQVKVSKASICYYAPNQRQLDAEERARTMSAPPPLKPRKDHNEAVERARAFREQYRSIG